MAIRKFKGANLSIEMIEFMRRFREENKISYKDQIEIGLQMLFDSFERKKNH